jgi:hypothetical protein
MTTLARAAALAAALAAYSSAAAQDSRRAESRPSNAISDGPLLAFSTFATGDAGRAGGKALTVFDPQRGASYRALAGIRGPITCEARLDARRALMRPYGDPEGLVVVDFEDESHRLLTPAPFGFVAVVGDEVLHLGEARRGDATLYAADWRRPKAPRRVHAGPLIGKPVVRGGVAFALSAGASPSLLRIDVATGAATSLMPLQPHRLTPRLRISASPDGRRVALVAASAADLDGAGDDANRGAALRVLDASDGTVLGSADSVDIHVSFYSSQTPTLRTAWIDDDRLRWSETFVSAVDPQGRKTESFRFVEWRISTGERKERDAYSPLGLGHADPERPEDAGSKGGRRAIGLFERDTGLLWFKGDVDPIADVRQSKQHGGEVWQDLTVSQDGVFASVRSGRGAARRLDLFDGRDRSRRTLATGATFDIEWIPAVRRS